MHKLKEFLHGHKSLKHGRHEHEWQGIALIAFFIIILLHIAAAYYFLYL